MALSHVLTLKSELTDRVTGRWRSTGREQVHDSGDWAVFLVYSERNRWKLS